MENLKLLLNIYFRPAFAFSEIMDKGSWVFAAVAVLVVSFAFQYGVHSKILETYAVTELDYYAGTLNFSGAVQIDEEAEISANPQAQAIPQRRPFPLIGKSIFYFFSFYSSFFTPLIGLSLFYFPATIILITLFGRLGNIGVVLRRDYATYATCALTAWAAAHLPLAVIAFLLNSSGGDGSVYLTFWLVSGLLFGALQIFALRTVFGVEYLPAFITIALSWIFYSLGLYIFQFISPLFFSPFLLFFAIILLGGFLGSEVRGFGNAMKQKRDLKRFLHNAMVNPNDADPHIQLGLIYQKRRQDEKALEHFTRAYEIDNEEIDANYELGKIARKNGDLQNAIGYFSVVVEQNEKYSLSEIWREIGATYLEADMPDEAFEALDKFVTKRPFDAEGLYYLGKVFEKQNKETEAKEMFERAIESVRTAPYYRRGELHKWSKLAQKEL
jgi:hypothetical protein